LIDGRMCDDIQDDLQKSNAHTACLKLAYSNIVLPLLINLVNLGIYLANISRGLCFGERVPQKKSVVLL
jgi:hypothetical protein